LKRGINGVYHHVGQLHLHRYLSEFDFRYNARKETDSNRTVLAMKGTTGKRLILRDSQRPNQGRSGQTIGCKSVKPACRRALR
jgi:hypothetical protein